MSCKNTASDNGFLEYLEDIIYFVGFWVIMVDRVVQIRFPNPVSPGDLAATIFEHLGIDIHQQYFDQFQRVPREICEGRALRNLG